MKSKVGLETRNGTQLTKTMILAGKWGGGGGGVVRLRWLKV